MDIMYYFIGVAIFMFMLYTNYPSDMRNTSVYPYIAVASVVIRLVAYLISIAYITQRGPQGRVLLSYLGLFYHSKVVKVSVIVLLFMGLLAVIIAIRNVKIAEDEMSSEVLNSVPQFLDGEERRAALYMEQELFFLRMHSASVVIAVGTIVEFMVIVLWMVLGRLMFIDMMQSSLLMVNSFLFMMFTVIHVYLVRIGFRVREIVIEMQQ